MLVCHTLRGRTSFEERKATELAKLGYAAMAAIGFCFGDKISASILVLHGWDDPMATPDSVVALDNELTALDADWQIHGYGRTVHAFTNPAANDRQRGALYDAAADRRSWIAMKNFLEEKLTQ